MSKNHWYKRKDGTLVLKKGRNKVLEIFKRPSGAYCCFVLCGGDMYASEGYHGRYLNTIAKAKKWGIDKAKEFNLL